jgi:hypothetical protein
MYSWSFNLKTDGDLKQDFQRNPSRLSFNGEGLGLQVQSLGMRSLILSNKGCIYSQGDSFPHTSKNGKN